MVTPPVPPYLELATSVIKLVTAMFGLSIMLRSAKKASETPPSRLKDS